jgi:hypothetical protein
MGLPPAFASKGILGGRRSAGERNSALAMAFTPLPRVAGEELPWWRVFVGGWHLAMLIFYLYYAFPFRPETPDHISGELRWPLCLLLLFT